MSIPQDSQDTTPAHSFQAAIDAERERFDLEKRKVAAFEKLAEAAVKLGEEAEIFNKLYVRYVEVTTGNVVGR